MPGPCSVCGKTSVARNLCQAHYGKAWKDGTLFDHDFAKPQRSTEERFMAFVVKAPNGCWEWNGTIGAASTPRVKPYGLFWLNGRNRAAHRVSYALFNGQLSASDLVCHRCDNPPCVNPEHLFLGDHAANAHDAMAKGRLATNDRHGQVRLSVEDVHAIRASGEPHHVLAERFDVTQSHISRIRSGRSRRAC